MVFSTCFNFSRNLAIRSSWSEPVHSRSCVYWLFRASPPLAGKNIINLILVLTIWWCPCVESSLAQAAAAGRRTKRGWEELPHIRGQGQRLIEFCQENTLVIANNTREDSTHGHHQMVNTKIRLIIFSAKDGEALYSQQKQDRELTVAQIMNSLLPNSDSNWRK